MYYFKNSQNSSFCIEHALHFLYLWWERFTNEIEGRSLVNQQQFKKLPIFRLFRTNNQIDLLDVFLYSKVYFMRELVKK